ncbi:hypothetical protein [Clostridium saccharoperbutylacetonicum]
MEEANKILEEIKEVFERNNVKRIEIDHLLYNKEIDKIYASDIIMDTEK